MAKTTMQVVESIENQALEIEADYDRQIEAVEQSYKQQLEDQKKALESSRD
ncbi:hypothetical protein [Fundicoccus culcitae]|uniref:Uncharacterized protein n=1 Tax=Fundicoccus culcitae TaxID=2969821 RepID=A0ABY5P5H1_9LACT|nr:hypothetical protein [Fundicoccus culcitae]UUX33957.1 hypothetical protein NRE15_13900 [Fundicoccus culcitae]